MVEILTDKQLKHPHSSYNSYWRSTCCHGFNCCNRFFCWILKWNLKELSDVTGRNSFTVSLISEEVNWDALKSCPVLVSNRMIAFVAEISVTWLVQHVDPFLHHCVCVRLCAVNGCFVMVPAAAAQGPQAEADAHWGEVMWWIPSLPWNKKAFFSSHYCGYFLFYYYEMKK